MKYILLFMVVLLIKPMIQSIKSLFRSQGKNDAEFVESVESVLDTEGVESDTLKGLLIILMAVAGVFSVMFYMLTSIYVGQIVFVMIGMLMIIRSIRETGILIQSVNDIKSRKIKSNKIYRVLGLGYKFYFIYYLVSTWNVH